jgi:hypothetical protein
VAFGQRSHIGKGAAFAAGGIQEET